MCGWKKRKETLMESKELSRGRIEGEKAKIEGLENESSIDRWKRKEILCNRNETILVEES